MLFRLQLKVDAPTRTEIAETRICSNFPPRPPVPDSSSNRPPLEFRGCRQVMSQ